MSRPGPCLLLLALALGACATPAPKVLYLVRHAEKAPDPGDGDPELSPLGRARAEDLARTLADVPLDHVFVTHLVRTQQTAAPTARVAGEAPIVLPADDVAGLVHHLRRLPEGTRSLVVGHSNTLPEVMRRLGVPAPELRGGDYDDLFVVIGVGEAYTLERLHFGAVHRHTSTATTAQ